jgi:hypothetical protein
MNFLKSIFGGGGGGDNRTCYVHVRPKKCDKIVKVRIDLHRELSATDDGKGYFTRKVVYAVRCPFQAEVVIKFNKRRKITEQEITNGDFVSAEEYEAWLVEQE